MTYIMSDAHNRWDLFNEMLEITGFSSADTLYFGGDAIDRGDGDGVAILQMIWNSPNMHMILGNHEWMMLEAAAGRSIENWLYNGGEKTYCYLATLGWEERQGLLKWLDEQPATRKIEVNGKKYVLSHGVPGRTIKETVWGRPYVDSELCTDGLLIIGHTPVCKLTGKSPSEKMEIFYGKNYIDIDCGCGHCVPGARLACLRLEDMAEFYVA